MIFMDLKGAFRSLVRTVSDKSPEILTGLSIGGFLTAGVLAIRNTPKAQKALIEAKREKQCTKLTVWETVQATIRYYAVPGTLFLASAACEIGAVGILKNRNTTLAAIASAAETTVSLYKDAAKEVVGEEKEKDIQQKADEKLIEKTQPTIEPSAVDQIRPGQAYIFFPVRPWRKFVSSVDKLQDAKNRINSRIAQEIDPWESLNDFFAEADLPIWTRDENEREDSRDGEALGFSLRKGFIELDIRPTKFLATFNDTKTACTVDGYIVDFVGSNQPRYDYKL